MEFPKVGDEVEVRGNFNQVIKVKVLESMPETGRIAAHDCTDGGKSLVAEFKLRGSQFEPMCFRRGR